MSNLILPSLKGMAIDMTRTPTHSTLRKKSQNMSEVRASLVAYPLYSIKLAFNYLLDQSAKDSDLRTLQGFYNRVHGSFDNFLVLDKWDNSVYRTNFAVGDGTTKQFRLAREYGGFIEPLYGVDPDSVTIYINGTETDAFTPSVDGYVVMNTAPKIGDIVSWSGIFYTRCIFDEDSVDFVRMYSDVWTCGEMKLWSVKEGG